MTARTRFAVRNLLAGAAAAALGVGLAAAAEAGEAAGE